MVAHEQNALTRLHANGKLTGGASRGFIDDHKIKNAAFDANALASDSYARTTYEVPTARQEFLKIAMARTEHSDPLAREFVKLKEPPSPVRINYPMSSRKLISQSL
jgi:hypothetical protein